MVRYVYLFTLCLLSLCSCKNDDPKRILAEDDRWQISLHKTELIAIDKVSKSETLLLKLCPGRCVYGSASDSTSVMVHKDSLCDVSKVYILSYHDEPLTLLLQDISNHTVCHSFVYKHGADSLIHLPSSGFFLGVSWDDCLIIMDSYDYNDKGRYGMVQGYTFDGEKVCEMTTKK